MSHDRLHLGLDAIVAEREVIEAAVVWSRTPPTDEVATRRLIAAVERLADLRGEPSAPKARA